MQPNWAKIVGELIADHEISSRKQIEPLVARIAELEIRPVQKDDPGKLGFVPPELAEQVMAAARMLEEPAPIRQTAPPVERVIGPPGERGPVGVDGARGDEGPPGRDGISITAAAINRDGELMLTLSNGTVLTPGRVEGRDAK